jgi:hypothetical protein
MSGILKAPQKEKPRATHAGAKVGYTSASDRECGGALSYRQPAILSGVRGQYFRFSLSQHHHIECFRLAAASITPIAPGGGENVLAIIRQDHAVFALGPMSSDSSTIIALASM